MRISKRIKKLTAVFTAIVMTMGLCITAGAVPEREYLDFEADITAGSLEVGQKLYQFEASLEITPSEYQEYFKLESYWLDVTGYTEEQVREMDEQDIGDFFVEDFDARAEEGKTYVWLPGVVPTDSEHGIGDLTVRVNEVEQQLYLIGDLRAPYIFFTVDAPAKELKDIKIEDVGPLSVGMTTKQYLSAFEPYFDFGKEVEFDSRFGLFKAKEGFVVTDETRLSDIDENIEVLKSDDKIEAGATYIVVFEIEFGEAVDIDVEGQAYVNGKAVNGYVSNSDPITMYIVYSETMPTYEFLDNSGNVEIKAGEANEMIFHIDAPLSQFKGLVIGDVELVKNEDYTLSEGSTIITLTDKGIAKVNGLSAGEYEIKAYFEGGVENVIGTMKVAKADEQPAPAEPKTSPKTGDAGFMGIFTIMMLVAAAGAVAYRKREF